MGIMLNYHDALLWCHVELLRTVRAGELQNPTH